jgi:hypothetical protein
MRNKVKGAAYFTSKRRRIDLNAIVFFSADVEDQRLESGAATFSSE